MVENSDEIQLNLHGFSGNKIELVRHSNKTFVRKTAKNLSENIKIQKEIDKMKLLLLLSKNSNDFKVPNITSIKKNSNELLSYEMDFIPGESLDFSLKKLDSKTIKSIAKQLNKIIETISKNNIECKINERDFLKQKFNELVDKFSDKNFSTKLNNDLFIEYAKKIENLELDKNDFNAKSTFCHGDLALDNILISKKNEIYLIDPLHNDFEYILWDYSKILQSSMIHWDLIKYQNFELEPNTKKILLNPNSHISLFHQHFIKDLPVYPQTKIILYLAATLSRVAKYSKTEKQFCALMLIINELLTDYVHGECKLYGSLSSLRW